MNGYWSRQFYAFNMKTASAYLAFFFCLRWNTIMDMIAKADKATIPNRIGIGESSPVLGAVRLASRSKVTLIL